MPFNSVKRKQNALKQVRGASGRFTSFTADTLKQVHASTQGFLGKQIHVEKTTDENPHKLIKIEVTDPFHKVYELLKDIKAKQTIPVSLKFSLPLVGLPFLMLAVFQLGRVQTSCPTITTTKAGTIKNIMVMIPKPPGSLEMVRRLIPQIPQLEEPGELLKEKRVILLDKENNATNIIHADKTTLIQYENQPVLLTGTYSSCTHSITLDSLENILIY